MVSEFMDNGQLTHLGLTRPGRPRWRLVFGVLVFLGVAGGAGLARSAGDARNAPPSGLARLDSLVAMGEVDEVLAEAAKLLASGSLRPQERWLVDQRVCAALTDAGQAHRALGTCEDAARAAPYDAANHRNFAACLTAVGQTGRAIGEFQAALELAPEQTDWRLEYAQTLRQMGVAREALAQLDRARTDCGGCPAATRALAQYYLTEGPAARAAPLLASLLAEHPDPAVRARYAQLLSDLGRFATVDSLLGPLGLAQLSVPETWMLLQADRALGRGARGVLLAPGNADSQGVSPDIAGQARYWGLVSELCLLAHDPGASLRAIDEAVAISPREAIWHHNRAAVLLELGRNEEAAEALARAKALGIGREQAR